MLRYELKDKQAFKRYFSPQPKPKKRGRPRKRKGRGKGKKKAKKHGVVGSGDSGAGFNTKRRVGQLSAQLQGAMTSAQHVKQSRKNWDTPANSKLRLRIAMSWQTKTDLYQDGNSFQRFCTKNGINRHVLL